MAKFILGCSRNQSSAGKGRSSWVMDVDATKDIRYTGSCEARMEVQNCPELSMDQSLSLTLDVFLNKLRAMRLGSQVQSISTWRVNVLGLGDMGNV